MIKQKLTSLEIGNDRRVVALGMTGTELWVSPSLMGLSPGSPTVSGDGDYVFLTHNTIGGTVGHFSILDGETGDLFFTQTFDSAPFAPLGIFLNPAEGYYDGGQNNRNDILVWSVQPKPNDTAVGPGVMFAFQMPIGFNGDKTELGYTRLGDDVKDFQAIQKPVLADEGRSLFWGTSRSQFRGWVGQQGVDRFRFDRARTAYVAFTRGFPAMQAVYATPAISNNPETRMLFCGTATTEFVKMTSDFLNETVTVTTGTIIKSSAHVSPDDLYVYYLEMDGNLHQASTTDLSDKWTLNLKDTTEGEFALNKAGTMLYVADASGLLQALRVGDAPTEAPSLAPSHLATSVPTTSPSSKQGVTANPTRSPHGSNPSPTSMAPNLEPRIATENPTNDGGSTGGTTPTGHPVPSEANHLRVAAFLFAFLPLLWF